MASYRQRGFTLIELMIVVAIVGILAIVGAVGYGKIISSSRSAESRHVLGSIRIAQESRRAETGSYASVSPAGGVYSDAELCPTNGKTTKKATWIGTSTTCDTKWTALPVKVDGSLYFGYSTTAGVRGTAPPAASIDGVNPFSVGPATNPPTDWFVAWAQLDSDGDGTSCHALTSSFSNEVFVENEGE